MCPKNEVEYRYTNLQITHANIHGRRIVDNKLIKRILKKNIYAKKGHLCTEKIGNKCVPVTLGKAASSKAVIRQPTLYFIRSRLK